MVQCPRLLERKDSELEALYSSDAIKRVREIDRHMVSVGAYSNSKGHKFIRDHIAEFLEARDGYPADPEHIFLTDGASEGIKRVLSCIIKGEKSGILLPIPQYPLYSAAVTLLGGSIVPYFLDESENWDLSIEELERSLNSAKLQGIQVKAMCLINPGNPTGNHFSESTLKDVAKFCYDNRIVLLADEVYQTNIYDSRPFNSMKKIVCDLRLELELFSFHSTSKGFIGECGKRGGYLECHNIDPVVIDEIYKLASICLCPNTDGQLMVDLMVCPPKPGDPSHKLYAEEKDLICQSLKRRALKLTDALNSLEGVKCCLPAGALYLFPSIDLPKKFIKEAESLSRSPDDLYCLKLLESTGICTVPGSGFGQVPGSYHFRMTFLPPESDFEKFIDLLCSFHKAFYNEYS